MNKENIYEEFYNAVKDSLEWALDDENKGYPNYIDGLCDITNRLLNKIDEKEDKNSK